MKFGKVNGILENIKRFHITILMVSRVLAQWTKMPNAKPTNSDVNFNLLPNTDNVWWYNLPIFLSIHKPDYLKYTPNTSSL